MTSATNCKSGILGTRKDQSLSLIDYIPRVSTQWIGVKLTPNSYFQPAETINLPAGTTPRKIPHLVRVKCRLVFFLSNGPKNYLPSMQLAKKRKPQSTLLVTISLAMSQSGIKCLSTQLCLAQTPHLHTLNKEEQL